MKETKEITNETSSESDKTLTCMYCQSKLKRVTIADTKTGTEKQVYGCEICWSKDPEFIGDLVFGRFRPAE